MHTVAVLALDQVIPFDLSTPFEVFSRTRLPDGRPGYQIRVCSERDEVDAGAFTLRAPWGLEGLQDADTIIVPGVTDPTAALSPAVRDTLRSAATDGTRIASICVGTFPFAATGLLDGLRATTHWRAARLLAATYPDIDVDSDVLYVDNGQFLTSAGAAAGLDLCLHMIRRDYGSAVAADAARLSVMPLEREGGQAQFIVHDHTPTPQGAELEALLAWLRGNLSRDLTLADIASRAGISTRTLIRRFRDQTGTTPLQWLHRARIRQAQHLLETTKHSVERVGSQVGFGSPTTFRDRFKRATGVSPQTYRRTFS
ncbi:MULTISPECIES: GlxA family transcriptional regulator [Streptomyces]|uniref:Helix-turn-helix domain-containing protein n=1 Tax=Streptomyces doudnae TaxID=3075536 RepID=A0ABD5F042_9ACTN|nr:MULTISPECIES: helix-turn-helix domain-containing protein [unclassified Streptomyces]MDT0440263.1 helix-turn-helix domain-containing protein [Streptomyces sp. DSM 41981]MYQ69317.1 helix-turn-helix domain-containing protein [Streptomyces sp. SID4950]SCE52843.1 Transcriptional regulator GlxA family, contains an amidase domain and an AraC-type DNA-binding HTH domain [Streptomyces sp. SolWspMP-5a-2]